MSDKKTRRKISKTTKTGPRSGLVAAVASGVWRRWRAASWRARLIALGFAAILAPVLFGGIVYATASIPEPDAIPRAQSSIVYDVKGREIGRLHAGEDRVDIPLSSMPLTLRRAVLAAEDKDFYSHRGLSPLGIVRAAVKNAISRSVSQGGSTITQQYVKNAFVGAERSAWRKIREAAIAIKLERNRSKNQILEAYLNTIYFGRGAFGVEAASRAYFGHPASKLALPESALLAALIRAPESLDPSKRLEAALAARNRVLDRMASLGMASLSDAEAAKDAKVVVRPRGAQVSGRAPYFVEDVRRALTREYGPDAVYRGGLRVTTTLDRDMQEAAEKAVSTVLDRPSDPEAALVAVDPATGGVRAMVGGRDFGRSEFNLASQGRRQPGSTFKAFVLAAAVNDGMPPTQRFRAPASITLKTGFEPWKVTNYDAKDYGTLTVDQATRFSVNTVYAQMILEIGPSRVREMAMAAGIGSKISAVPSLALGTSELTPLELASAYGTFAARGSYAKPHLVRRITDAKGREIFKAADESFSSVGVDVADTVNHVLQNVVKGGTGRRADLGRPVAGKTGTTQSHRDAWFAGYTPNLATVVWMGFPDGERTMENVRGIAVTGSSFPVRIWRSFMERAVAGLPVEDFAPPPSFESPSAVPTPTTTATSTASPTAPAQPPQHTGSPAPTATAEPPKPSPSQTPKPSQSSSPAPSPSASGSSSPAPEPSSAGAEPSSGPSPGGPSG